MTNHFKIQELVSKKTYEKYGNKCWEFINPRIVMFINKLREDLDRPIIINNWVYGGKFEQRGLRTNLDEIVKEKTKRNIMYVSQHCLGNAVDFNVKGMTSKEVYDYIIENYDRYSKFINRMEHIESATSWTHVDCAFTRKKELIIFRA